MKILLVADQYPPELRSAANLMKDLADGLNDRGHDVSVVTSYPHHSVTESGEIPKVRDENGVQVIRTSVIPHHNVSNIKKGISWLTLPYLFKWSASKHIEDLDAVLVHSPPLPLYKAGSSIASKFDAEFVLNLHDFFPQNAVDLGVLNNSLLIKFFESMEQNAYDSADTIMVPSPTHKEFLKENRDVDENKEIYTVPHWVDTEEFDEIDESEGEEVLKKWNLEDKFVALFGGVMGPSQGLDKMLDMAAKMKENQEMEDFQFLFVGKGNEKEKLKERVEKENLDNVKIGPLLSKDKYISLVKASDVGLVTLTSKNNTPATPAKLMDYMAASSPVAVFVHEQSDAHRIVQEADCGVQAVWKNDEEVYNALKKLYENQSKLEEYGSRSREYLENHFSKDVCMNQIEDLIYEQAK